MVINLLQATRTYGANRLANGKVAELVTLPSQYVAIISDGTINGVEGYSFTLVGWDQLDAKDVIHLKYFNPYFNTNGQQLYGLSPLQAAYRTVQRSNDAKDTSVGMLQNQGPRVSCMQMSQMISGLNKLVS